MVTSGTARVEPEPQYLGMRCSADEYLDLVDDGFAYQLINGVVIMSPKPTPEHQEVLAEIVIQLGAFLRGKSEAGSVLPDVDVRFGADLVYSPDLIYLAPGSRYNRRKAITLVPDLAIEIISPGSHRMDFKTKRSDYERFGVREYWIVEPAEKRVRVLRLTDGKYVETIESGDTAPSQVIPGFAFDLVALRKVMEA